MKFVECPTPTFTRGEARLPNNPVNLELVLTFVRGNDILHRTGSPCITFLTATRESAQWIFDSEEDRNTAYTMLKDAVCPDLRRFAFGSLT